MINENVCSYWTDFVTWMYYSYSYSYAPHVYENVWNILEIVAKLLDY